MVVEGEREMQKDKVKEAYVFKVWVSAVLN